MITRFTRSGSLRLTEDGSEFAFVEGPDHTENKVNKRLRFYLAEWFADQRLGVPYHQQILGKKTPEPVVRSIFSQTISRTPGIAKLDRLGIEFDPRARTMSIDWAATMLDGSHISSKPFIIV